jgi:hypothetical protein
MGLTESHTLLALVPWYSQQHLSYCHRSVNCRYHTAMLVSTVGITLPCYSQLPV